jgi:hypothetical protein
MFLERGLRLSCETVIPGPCEQGLSCWRTVGESDGIIEFQWTSTDDRMDNFESFSLIIGKGELTRSAIMGSTAGDSTRQRVGGGIITRLG